MVMSTRDRNCETLQPEALSQTPVLRASVKNSRATSLESWMRSTWGRTLLALVPSVPLRVTLTPVHEAAEFAVSKYIPVAYWEGAVSVEGDKNGGSITGRGFVELVGYAPKQQGPLPRANAVHVHLHGIATVL